MNVSTTRASGFVAPGFGSPRLAWSMLLAGACALSAAAEALPVRIRADRVLFRLHPEVRGVNMEDLHYQMVGGIDSQMLHGESFYEHSPTELAPLKAQLAGFATVNGAWSATGGVVRVTVRPGDGTPWLEGGLDGGRPPQLKTDAQLKEPAKNPGARMTTLEPVAAGTVETRVLLMIPKGATAAASLIAHVPPNHSDNGWDWYSGYTVELDPAGRIVRLLSARHASRHEELGRAPVDLPEEQWIPVALRAEGGRLVVRVGAKAVLDLVAPRPHPPGRIGVATRGSIAIRDLATVSADGVARPVELRPNPLLAEPGDALSMRWGRVQSGNAQGRFAFDADGWHAGLRSQRVEFADGEGEFGCENRGLEGIGLSLQAGKPYEGFVRVKSAARAEVFVSLRGADGREILAEQRLECAGGGGYEKLPFSLTPRSGSERGGFAITLRRPGTVTLGYAFLQPGEWGRFRGLPVRRDLAEALAGQGTRLLRLNGGMIEVPGYRWKNLRGPRDLRAPYNGFYDRYCSSGYGPVEHLAFCRAAGFTPVLGLNVDETPEDVADFIAYCNATRGTPAGDLRAADGHPEPFGLRHYQIGNESGVTAQYAAAFKAVAEAVWKVDPGLILIPPGSAYPLDVFKPDADPEEVRKRLAVHLDLTRFVKERGREILWDVHVFNKQDNPAESYNGHLPGGIEFSRWLTRLEPSFGPLPLLIGEFNAGRYNYGRGLGHAVELAQAHRAGDLVWGTAIPNVSQPSGVFQSDWKAVLWTQGNFDYTPGRLWYQASYHVQKMVADAWAPDVHEVVSAAPRGTVDVFAARTEDGRKLVVRAVNLTKEPREIALGVDGFAPTRPVARMVTLAHDDLLDSNTAETPELIAPVTGEWKHDGLSAPLRLPPRSFTVLELE